VKWWQEAIVWALAFIAYLVLTAQLPAGRQINQILLLLTVVGIVAWKLWKRR